MAAITIIGAAAGRGLQEGVQAAYQDR